MLSGMELCLMNTAQTLEQLAQVVEGAEPSTHCQIDYLGCQIIASFDKRPDVKVALLTPMAQQQIKRGNLDRDIVSELLFSIRRIANTTF